MGFSIRQNIKVAVAKEVTEGTYEAPTASEFITSLEDGLEVVGTKEALERNILGQGLRKAQQRTANRAVSGTIPVEFKAGSNEGDAPEYGDLMEAALGGTRNQTTAVTTGTGHTTTVINIEDADIGKINKGDIVVVKEAGAYHISPVSDQDDTPGSATITLLIAAASAPSDNVDIAAFTTYFTTNDGHPTFSVTKYIEDNIRTIGTGCRITSLSLESFTANATASWSFAFEGLDFATTVNALALTPTYDTSLPPIIVNACVYKAGVQLPVSELTLSLENTVAFTTSTCAASGKIGSRISERTISGSMTPYVQDNDVDIQTEFDNDTLYSIFGYAYNETGVAGEFNQVIAFYLPNCSTTELAESDLDGVLQHSITFSASGGTDGSETELFIAYI